MVTANIGLRKELRSGLSNGCKKDRKKQGSGGQTFRRQKLDTCELA